MYCPLPTGEKKLKKKVSSQTVFTLASLRKMLNEADDELRSKGIPEVKAGNLPRLVKLLIDPDFSTLKYKRTFFLMRPTFASSVEVLNELISLYQLRKVVGGKVDSTNEVVAVIIDWMKSFFEEDWRSDPNVLRTFEKFLQDLLGTNATSQTKANHKVLLDEFNSLNGKKIHQDPILSWVDRSDGADIPIQAFTPPLVADTLTAYCFQLFRSVREREHLAFLRGKVGEYENVEKLIGFFNRISNWTSREIVTTLRMHERVTLIERFGAIATRLIECNNFLCAKAVVLGLTSSYVQRMERTFQSVPSDVISKIVDLDKKLSLEKNFKFYRNLMETASPPCIPYLGMCQRDLVFLNDGQPNLIGNLIHFNKRFRMAEVIFDLSSCQIGAHRDLTVEPAFISALLSIPLLTEKELYLSSRRADPKDPEMVIAELVRGEEDFVCQIADLEQEVDSHKKRIQELEQQLKHANLNGGGAAAGKASPPRGLSPRRTSSRIRPSMSFEKRSRPRTSRMTLVAPPVMVSGGQNPSKWSVEEVCEWVAKIIGSEFVQPFADNLILGADLVDMGNREISLFVGQGDDNCAKLQKGISSLREMEGLPPGPPPSSSSSQLNPHLPSQQTTTTTTGGETTGGTTTIPIPAPRRPSRPSRDIPLTISCDAIQQNSFPHSPSSSISSSPPSSPLPFTLPPPSSNSIPEPICASPGRTPKSPSLSSPLPPPMGGRARTSTPQNLPKVAGSPRIASPQTRKRVKSIEPTP